MMTDFYSLHDNSRTAHMLITLPLLFLFVAEENFDLREDVEGEFAAAAASAAVESKDCFKLLLPRDAL